MSKHRFLARAAVLAGLALFAAGCGDNAGEPLGYGPEGESGNALLLTNALPATADSSVVFLFATVIAPPPANGFRFYINPADRGYRPANDAPLSPSNTLTSGWSVYLTLVEGFDPAVDNRVQARGARDGVESSASPLTNVSFIPASAPIDLVRYGSFLLPPTESLLNEIPADTTLSWPAVPGATGYLFSLFGTGGQSIYLAYVTGTSHRFDVGPGLILHSIPRFPGGQYAWNVQAIDAGSRVFALSDVRTFQIRVPPIR